MDVLTVQEIFLMGVLVILIPILQFNLVVVTLLATINVEIVMKI